MTNDDSINKNSLDLDDLNFRNHAVSANLTENLQHMDIDTYLKQNKQNMISHSLTKHLRLLLKQKGVTKADVVRGSQLTAEETQTMLKLAGYRELYVRDTWDTIILYALQRGKNILETNDLLYEHKCKVLAIPED